MIWDKSHIELYNSKEGDSWGNIKVVKRTQKKYIWNQVWLLQLKIVNLVLIIYHPKVLNEITGVIRWLIKF